jgi:urease accessory protein
VRSASGSAGPVGTGKTALVAALCGLLVRRTAHRRRHQRHLHDRGRRHPASDAGCSTPSASPPSQTGCCPHTAIRDDITANLDAIEDLEEREGPLDLRAGRERRRQPHADLLDGAVDVQLFVLDVAGGDKVPRKGGPGVTRSDLLVINKTDLAHAGPRRPRRDGARRRRPAG